MTRGMPGADRGSPPLPVPVTPSRQDISAIQDLVGRLYARERGFPDAAEADPGHLQSLVYANALLRYAAIAPSLPGLPKQLVVIGPTQSGKSTLVNLLLGGALAEASPLAGFTRHAQGFLAGGGTDEASPDLSPLLPDWERLPEADQPHARGDQYSIQAVAASAPLLERQPVLVWDTPDFDSVGSRDYRHNVPEICALADLILLVVSREEYADQSVWRMLRLLSGIGIPLLICLNKTTPESEAPLMRSLESRLADESIACKGLFTLSYQPGMGEERVQWQEADPLRRRCVELLAGQRASRPGLANFLRAHWTSWTGPVRRELAAGERWRQQVEHALDEALQLYERDYLEDPRYSDTLQRAVVRLLELLEIPGIAAALVRARKLITWPANRLRGLFREHRRRAVNGEVLDSEIRVLEESLGHMWIQLQHEMAEQALQPPAAVADWWRTLAADFSHGRAAMEQAFRDAAEAYREDFENEIEDAAERLLRHLQAHPVTLNSLRAARITTDAAAVALAVKTGGIGLNDLIVAPAMLSFTTLLTEGAVGSYMQQVGKELRQRQRERVEAELFHGLVRPRLLALPSQLQCDRCYGIDRRTLERAERALGAADG